jgi:transposase
MIVIGTDAHKVTHTCGAVEGETGQLAGELTAKARKAGFEELIAWGRGLDSERIWAIEDYRHVSAAFERFLIARGERVLRVPPKLMGQSRRSERARGKPDAIDALAIARAALKEGPETLPGAHLDAEAMEVKLLVDHREDLVRSRSEEQCRLRWHLHDLWPELELPAGCLDRTVWLDRLTRRLARTEQGARVRVCRDLVRSIKERSKRAAELEREIAALVRAKAPELLAVPGCGPLSAAKVLAETAGVERFDSDAKLARLAGVAPIPASSGNRQRHRLDRGAIASSTAPCTESRSPRAASISRRGSSSPESRPRASRGSRRFAASSATLPERSGRLFEPRATESS